MGEVFLEMKNSSAANCFNIRDSEVGGQFSIGDVHYSDPSQLPTGGVWGGHCRKQTAPCKVRLVGLLFGAVQAEYLQGLACRPATSTL